MIRGGRGRDRVMKVTKAGPPEKNRKDREPGEYNVEGAVMSIDISQRTFISGLGKSEGRYCGRPYHFSVRGTVQSYHIKIHSD